jgi:hypothetical protein
VEYCSAEEISHLETGNGNQPENGNRSKPEPRKQIEHQTPALPAPANNEPLPQENGKPSEIPVSGNGNMSESKIGKVEISFQPTDTSATVYRPQFKTYETDADAPAQNNGNGNGNSKKQMSVKQFEYIKSMGKKLGFDLAGLSQKSIEIFNRELPYLTVTEASTFIDHMQAGLFRSNNTAV